MRETVENWTKATLHRLAAREDKRRLGYIVPTVDYGRSEPRMALRSWIGDVVLGGCLGSE